MPTMLYRCPGPHEIHGGRYDYTIVPDDEVEASVSAGWYLTTPEALAAHEAASDTSPPTREELEEMAGKLGVQFSGRTSDRKLRALVDAAAGG